MHSYNLHNRTWPHSEPHVFFCTCEISRGAPSRFCMLQDPFHNYMDIGTAGFQFSEMIVEQLGWPEKSITWRTEMFKLSGIQNRIGPIFHSHLSSVSTPSESSDVKWKTMSCRDRRASLEHVPFEYGGLNPGSVILPRLLL